MTAPEKHDIHRKRESSGKLFFNQDSDNHYYHPLPGEMTVKHLNRIVDPLNHTHTRVFVLGANAKFATFPSTAWEVITDALLPDDAARFTGVADSGAADDPWFHRSAMNLRALFAQGIDPPAYMLARARRYGMEGWLSVRMNDGHARNQPDHPLNSRFYREHPEYWTVGNTLGNAWDYALAPVRAHFLALITELLDRYDLDGIELDWNRSPNHFRDGHYDEGRAILTRWMGEVRQAVEATAARRKHRIQLVVRVPARPEVARGIGLDAVAWARRGYVNRLIVGPYKGTTDYDVPVEQWKRLLRGTGVPVTVCLEHVVSFFPGAPNRWSHFWCMTREQLRGAAIGALHRGSDGIYLFNHMSRPADDPELFRELGDLNTLESTGRDYLVTWVSPEIPGQPIPCDLPRIIEPGGTAAFRIYTGPKPARGVLGTVFLTLAGPVREAHPGLYVTVNDHPTEQQIAGTSPVFPDHARLPFLVASDSFSRGYTNIEVRNGTVEEIEINGVELTMRFPG